MTGTVQYATDPRRGLQSKAVFKVLTAVLAFAPVVVLLTVFFVVPMLYLFRMSLIENRADLSAGVFVARFVTTHYYKLLSNDFFYEMIANSFKMSILTGIIATAIGYVVAWYLTQTHGWERTILSSICLLPIFVNLVVAVFGWSVILLPFGIIQKSLVAAGMMDDVPLRIGRSVWGLVIVLVYQALPFSILILASSIQSIRKDKISAARLLGAGTPRIIWTVLLPLTMPGIFASFILAFSIAVSSYLIPVLIGAGRIPVLPMNIYSVTMETGDLPMGAAMSMILLGVVVVMTYVFGKVAAHVGRRGQWRMV